MPVSAAKGLVRPPPDPTHTGHRAVQVWRGRSSGAWAGDPSCEGPGPPRTAAVQQGPEGQQGLVEEVALLLGLGQAVLAVQVVHPHPLGAALGAAGAGERPGPALSLAGARPLLSVPITGQ